MTLITMGMSKCICDNVYNVYMVRMYLPTVNFKVAGGNHKASRSILGCREQVKHISSYTYTIKITTS